jgi:uncharacterized protein Yka (UPF0111/DUF47 family)
MKDIEHRGDELVHTVFEELNKTFITPSTGRTSSP